MDNINRNGNWFIDQLNVFQSANSDDVSVKKNFIVRKEEYELIVAGLKNKSSNDPLQHELILGRRGSGKSTLLKRIEIEIKENNELTNSYIAINLAEEQAGIYRLFDLWEEVINELRQILNIDIPLLEYETFKTNHEYTRYLYENIHNVCQQYNKRIVLLLDNFDRIVENFSDDGSLLRETLINYNDVQLICGSTRMDEHFWRYDMPFYEFFRTHRLESLTRTEIETLLIHWSESLFIPELKFFVKNNPGKLENIRILTDGLPRTIQFFVQIVLQKKESDTYEYLKKIMDNVTPLYQERLNHLPAQMRKTILEMAFIWEACTTKQLVERIKMESKLISANLTTLVEKGIVDKIETGKKQHLYRISERFFNMWLIVTQGNPEQKRKAKWLSVFLENWYNEHDFKTLSGFHIERLKSGNFRENDLLLYSKALSQSKYITLDERDTIIRLTKEASKAKADDKLIMLPELSENITSNIIKLLQEKNYKKAIECINEIENEADGIKFGFLGLCYDHLKDYLNAKKYYLLAIEKGDDIATYNLALMYQNQEKFDKAEKYYLAAIDKGVHESYSNLAVLYVNQERYNEAEKYFLMAIENGYVGPLNNLAILYSNQERYEEAEKYYLLAIENGHVDALFNLALIYANQEKYKEAEKYFLMAIENGDVESFFNLALMYTKQERYVEAEKYYLLAIEKGNVDALFSLALMYKNQAKYEEAEKYYLLAIEKGDVDALFNLALMYENQEKYEEAEKYYQMAIEKEDIGALNNLALLYKNQEKYEEAEKYFLLAIEKEDIGALNNLALLYKNQEKYEEAEKYFLLAIEKGDNGALNNVALFYDNQKKYGDAEKYFLLAIEKEDLYALFNLAILYYNLEKYEEAEKYFWLAIEKGNIDALNNLALLYYFKNTNKAKALDLISKASAMEISPEHKDSEIIIEIWNGIFRNLEKRMVSVIKEKDFKNLDEFIIELFVQQQKTLVLSLFQHAEIGKNLQEKYMVLYYITLIINNQFENNLMLRIPPELQTTIDDVIAKIKERQKIYGYN